MTSLNISVGQLRQAVDLKEQIERLQGELEGILNGGRQRMAIGPASRGGRRRMSAAGRARIAAAARARWAKLRANNGGSRSAAPKRKRRKMSAAGRARIAAAQRARWAKIKGR